MILKYVYKIKKNLYLYNIMNFFLLFDVGYDKVNPKFLILKAIFDFE